MIHAKSDSDVTSLVFSSPGSPKPPAYFVQSPSRDSHDSDKSLRTTPAYHSPSDSPSHSSTMASSSASRVSGTFRSSKGSRKNRWPRHNVIKEEKGEYDDDDHRYYYGDDDEEGFRRRFRCFVWFLGFVSLFTLFCLIMLGASRPYRPQVVVQSLMVNNFYFGQGADYTGVPTRLLTVNCSVNMIIHNSATFFGIYVSSTPVDLFYSDLTVATGQLKKYYQPRKSQRIVSVNLEGNKVPLYGAGASLAVSESSGDGVPLRLDFVIRSQGNVVGKLVKTKHRRHILCSLVFNSGNTQAIKFKGESCKYD